MTFNENDISCFRIQIRVYSRDSRALLLNRCVKHSNIFGKDYEWGTGTHRCSDCAAERGADGPSDRPYLSRAVHGLDSRRQVGGCSLSTGSINVWQRWWRSLGPTQSCWNPGLARCKASTSLSRYTSSPQRRSMCFLAAVPICARNVA